MKTLYAEDLEPEEALAIAVFERAIFQAQRGRPNAIAWFARRDDNFTFWCQVLDWNPEAVSEGVQRLLGGGKQGYYRPRRGR